jgi:uncharacterized protein YkwD
MNPVDPLLGLVILTSIWAGLRRGLLLAGADLLVLLASLVFALLAYPYGMRLAAQAGLQWGVWTAPLAFLVAYGVARVGLGVIVSAVVRRTPRTVHAHGVNRVLGMVPGAANGLLNAVIVSMLLLSLPLSDAITRAARDSVLVNRLAAPAQWLEAVLRPIFEPALDKSLSRLTVQPGSNDFVRLPFTVAASQQRPDLEVSMLRLLNEERKKHGLPPLQADSDATETARAHSRDMFQRGYFSHVTPEGDDPFDRMRRDGLRFRAAGENLALARTLPTAHQGLMDSPGHRANILRPAFGRVGIGIVDGGRYGLMVTQKFRN